MRRVTNYPPGVTGNEPQIRGEDWQDQYCWELTDRAPEEEEGEDEDGVEEEDEDDEEDE